ncbi:hypothetical protein UCRPC4_g06517 [Phaeomoniella chlamydospora]|uniref:Uncharacterized protein n=1 Tax=Phaeomoniella chlamydospora TaxID=158046 RepID=A0A0G2DWJ1_PHACM|nr:hypothetical protein UCRPC4_g06517 [Phaeomoniella chlamydospora]
MPVHPSEENAESNITEKVMKDPSSNTESKASDHSLHSDEQGSQGGIKAKAQDFISKGPQITDKLPEAASKDDLKARAAELNK